MKFLKIKETCLYVHDLEAAKSFYHGKLGLEVINYLPGKHIFFRAGSSVLLCFNPEDSRQKKSPPAHYGGGKQHFAFEVPEADYAESRRIIISLGIEITDEVAWSNGQTSFYFEDPEGNVLEILPEGAIWG
jgi:catechol 2,3-dioxygenase-like lactoylglutathione lyase family enzyme